MMEVSWKFLYIMKSWKPYLALLFQILQNISLYRFVSREHPAYQNWSESNRI